MNREELSSRGRGKIGFLSRQRKRGASLTPGIGRAEVWMFDATRPTAAPRILAKPRALAASADGRYVFVAVFHSGNGTATVSGEDVVRLGRAPRLCFNRIPYSAIPKQGAVVRRMNDRWQDYQNRDWTAVVPFELPDYDVFVIDAAGETPKAGQRRNLGLEYGSLQLCAP
jgi:hypothetical protein